MWVVESSIAKSETALKACVMAPERPGITTCQY
jgi:hypothetical protein